MTFDRQYKKDAFYAYKAWLNPEPMVHICSKKYIDRVEDVTKVTVYSNCDEVELFRNGESVGKQKKGDFHFFYFDVKNEGTSTLEVKAGELTDTATINKVDTPNEDYIMKEENQVINWFEITTPMGYFSINDSIGDIMSTLKGKIALFKLLMLMKNVMSQGTKDGKPEVMGFSFGKINKSMIQSLYGMVKGFTIKRTFSMTGNKFSKEQILEVNAMLNKIKKK
jgi:beta-galactosidase